MNRAQARRKLRPSRPLVSEYWMSRIMQHRIKPVAAKTRIEIKGWHTLRHYSDFRTIPGETGIRSAIDVMT
jgi:hypothetical protein